MSVLLRAQLLLARTVRHVARPLALASFASCSLLLLAPLIPGRWSRTVGLAGLAGVITTLAARWLDEWSERFVVEQDDRISSRSIPSSMGYLADEGGRFLAHLSLLAARGHDMHPGEFESWQRSAAALPLCAFVAIPAARYHSNVARHLVRVVEDESLPGWARTDVRRLRQLPAIIERLLPGDASRRDRHLGALELLAFTICHEVELTAAMERHDVADAEREPIAACVSLWRRALVE